MKKFKDPAALQEEFNKDKRNMVLEREATKHQSDAMRELVEVISAPLGRRAAILKSSELHRRIENLEKKLSAYALSVHQLNEYISSNKRETRYDTLLANALEDCEKINSILVARHG